MSPGASAGTSSSNQDQAVIETRGLVQGMDDAFDEGGLHTGATSRLGRLWYQRLGTASCQLLAVDERPKPQVRRQRWVQAHRVRPDGP